jgi:hypothetical protein
VHWLVVGQATPVREPRPPTAIGVAPPGVDGLKVTASPESSVAVHWLVEGQATPVRPLPFRLVGVGVPGDVGLNVTS